MDVYELGGIRLHLLVVEPGFPGEADRVHRELQRLSPALVLGDVDTEDALRLRAALAEKKGVFEPAFLDALYASEVQRRFAGDAMPGDHPVAAAARHARDRRAEFVPLRPAEGKAPGFLARRKLRRLAQAVEARDRGAFPAAFAGALQKAGAWDPAEDAEAAQKRLTRALTGGRAPVVAVVQAHRAAAFRQLIQRTGRIPV